MEFINIGEYLVKISEIYFIKREESFIDVHYNEISVRIRIKFESEEIAKTEFFKICQKLVK